MVSSVAVPDAVKCEGAVETNKPSSKTEEELGKRRVYVEIVLAR